MTEKFNAVKCDYNNEEGFWCVDAWKTSNPNEGGRVVAFIHEKTGQIAYADPDARVSSLAQEVILDKVRQIRSCDGMEPYELIPSFDVLYEGIKNYILRYQGKKGFVSTQNLRKSPICCLDYVDGQNVEYKIHGIRVKDGSLEILFDCDNVGFNNIEYQVADFNSPDADWRSLRDGEILYPQTLLNIAEEIDSYVEHEAGDPGVFAFVTTRKDELVSAFMGKLKELWENRWFDLVAKYPALLKALSSLDENEFWWDGPEASRIFHDELLPAFGECAPEGFGFGLNGDEYGFWPNSNA